MVRYTFGAVERLYDYGNFHELMIFIMQKLHSSELTWQKSVEIMAYSGIQSVVSKRIIHVVFVITSGQEIFGSNNNNKQNIVLVK